MRFIGIDLLPHGFLTPAFPLLTRKVIGARWVLAFLYLCGACTVCITLLGARTDSIPSALGFACLSIRYFSGATRLWVFYYLSESFALSGLPLGLLPWH